MSNVSTPDATLDTLASDAPAAEPPGKLEYSVSSGLLARLAQLKISFAFTSYQSNSLYLIGRNTQGGINIHQSAMPKPMGLSLDEDGGLTMSGAYQILRLQNVLEPEQRINNAFDACYVPRVVHITGQLDAHDVGVDQQSRDNVEGFNADTGGVALGYDRDMGQWRAGVAFRTGETDVDNDRFASDSIDIESYEFIAYGGFWQDQWFANATASGASLDYDFNCNNLIAGEVPIKSDTDGNLLGMSVGAGYQFNVSSDVVLTPQLALRYNTPDVDSYYTEDGGLDLRVDYDDIDTLTSEMGVSASTQFAVGDWQVAPMSRVAWIHEYLGDKEKATASYSGQSYIQKGYNPEDDLVSLDLGIEASNQHGVSISPDYRGTMGSDYTNNQGWLNVRYEF